MPTKTTYYAIVDELSSKEDRRSRQAGSSTMKASTTRPSPAAWRGSAQCCCTRMSGETGIAEFYEISEDEASQIVERIRRIAADA